MQLAEQRSGRKHPPAPLGQGESVDGQGTAVHPAEPVAGRGESGQQLRCESRPRQSDRLERVGFGRRQFGVRVALVYVGDRLAEQQLALERVEHRDLAERRLVVQRYGRAEQGHSRHHGLGPAAAQQGTE